jgi:hypothetical protein
MPRHRTHGVAFKRQVDAQAADRLVRKRALELGFPKRAARSAPLPRSAPTSVITCRLTVAEGCRPMGIARSAMAAICAAFEAYGWRRVQAVSRSPSSARLSSLVLRPGSGRRTPRPPGARSSGCRRGRDGSRSGMLDELSPDSGAVPRCHPSPRSLQPPLPEPHPLQPREPPHPLELGLEPPQPAADYIHPRADPQPAVSATLRHERIRGHASALAVRDSSSCGASDPHGAKSRTGMKLSGGRDRRPEGQLPGRAGGPNRSWQHREGAAVALAPPRRAMRRPAVAGLSERAGC